MEENRDRVSCCLHPRRFLLSAVWHPVPRVIITMLMVPASLSPRLAFVPRFNFHIYLPGRKIHCGSCGLVQLSSMKGCFFGPLSHGQALEAIPSILC